MTDDDILIPEVTVTGNYPTLTRAKINLFSLDYALSSQGNLGFPQRVIAEIYGYTNSGKSTLAYFVAGKIADRKITIADLEMADTENYIKRATASAGFRGEVRMVDVTDGKGKPRTHEWMLMSLAKDLLKEDVRSAIWDSVGATQSMVQLDVLTDPKAIFGEAFIGKRARLVSDVSLALRTALITKQTPSTMLVVNHVHSVIGGRGHQTIGGERLKFLSGVRLMLWPTETFLADDDDPSSDVLGFLVSGQVEKLRFGAKTRKFQFYIVPGYGVHEGVSAMFDAFAFGEAERGARVKLDGKSLGYLKADLLSYAVEGRRRKFYPFQEKMQTLAERIEKGDFLEGKEG